MSKIGRNIRLLGVNEMLCHRANRPYQTAAAFYVLLIEKRRAETGNADPNVSGWVKDVAGFSSPFSFVPFLFLRR
jgi:hypothetical protein